MRIARVSKDGKTGLAISKNGKVYARLDGDNDLDALVTGGQSALNAAAAAITASGEIDESSLTFLPPLARSGKVICLGLNYADHAAESGLAIPEFPTVFARFASNLIGHGAPILKPVNSDQLDYEAELVVIIGKRGRNISETDALSHVIGYSVFNDGSVRDFQLKTPQWTVGKNFDDTGAFGPWLVTPDEVPAGATGLKIETRLNGQVMQSSNTDQLIFNVARTISLLSSCFTLEVGDLLVMGTPSGVGIARNPQVFMKPGDVCEIEIEGIGLLRNPIGAA